MIIEQQTLMTNVVEVFVVYSEKEEGKIKNCLDKFLESYLFPLANDISINFTVRKNIFPDRVDEEELSDRFKSAQIVILMLSPTFFTDDECTKYLEYMKNTKNVNNSSSKRFIPIRLSNHPLIAKYENHKILPISSQKKSKHTPSLSNSRNHETIFNNTIIEIQKVIQDYVNPAKETVDPSKQVDKISLRELLHELDYKPQANVFMEFKNDQNQHNHIGIFFIHGNREQGQFWLFNRLVKRIDPNDAENYKLDFNRKGSERSAMELWKELAEHLEIKPLPNYIFNSTKIEDKQKVLSYKQKIIEKIHGQWRNKSVFIVLSRVHDLEDEEGINKFLQEFWYPLIEMVEKTLSQLPVKHYLLMFFLDEANCIDVWRIPFADKADQNWQPRIPIKLEKLHQFSYEELEDFFKKAQKRDIVFNDLTLQSLWEESYHGIPDLAIEFICGDFGYEPQDLMRFHK